MNQNHPSSPVYVERGEGRGEGGEGRAWDEEAKYNMFYDAQSADRKGQITPVNVDYRTFLYSSTVAISHTTEIIQVIHHHLIVYSVLF